MTEEDSKKPKVKKGELIALFAVIVLGCSIVIPMVMSYWKDAKFSHYMGLAKKQQILGVDDNAIDNYKKSLEIDPKNVNAYIGMAEIYSNGEFVNYDRAKEILQKAKSEIKDKDDLLRIEEKEKEIDKLIQEFRERSTLSEDEVFQEQIKQKD